MCKQWETLCIRAVCACQEIKSYIEAYINSISLESIHVNTTFRVFIQNDLIPTETKIVHVNIASDS